MMHDVEISRYDNSMNEFQKEIETYNELTFVRESIWLTRVEKRENKTHTFVKINLKFKNDVDKAIKKELIVNEKALQVTEFLNNRINQCHNCQKFEHLINTCREINAKCRLCAKNHDIRMHICVWYTNQRNHVLIYHRNAQIVTKLTQQMIRTASIFELSKLNRRKVINLRLYEWYNYSRNSILATQLCKIYKHDNLVTKVWFKEKDWHYMHARIVNWFESNHYFYSTCNKILFEQKQIETPKQRIVTFVSKKFIFFVTSRSNLCLNTNIQILNISKTNIENFTVFNVYNKKSQKSSSEKYTIERKLTTINLTKNSIICEDFNAHHQRWNSRITSSVRANALIDWLNKFNCELINISNKYTFTDENSNSVIDLTFATIDLASKITNWSINDDAEIDSNHEIIKFSINVENIETVNNSMIEKFNTQKTNWNKFSKYIKNNHSSIKNRMSRLLNNSCQESLNEDAKLLRNVIIETSDVFISKRRSCENSEVWWTDELTQLKKILAKAKRMYKVLSNEENLSIFKRNRNDYFQTIRFAKKEFWSNFLNNAIEKKIFQAYKFIKNNRMKKLSSIQYEKKTNIEFENKFNVFLEAMYSTSSNVENMNDETKIRLKLTSDWFKWFNLIEWKLRKTIFISASNKASKSNQLIFLIVQKAYNSISNIFFMLYSELINRDHHLVCWREEIEAILKKSNKSNYTASKAYRIITFLNYLEKIFEKIIVSRLLCFEQTSNLLDLNQINERKSLSTIDAVMNLTHDIELSFEKKKSTTCVFLNIKEAYNYVSIKQLLNVMKKLHLSHQTLKWIEEFINNRSIELTFNEKKQDKRQIRIEILQESSISSILFLIYTRFLFAKLKIDVNIVTSSFVNDIVI